MHPLNSEKYFGTTGLAISYYNGTSVVTGYITKQISTNKFNVTDGTYPKNGLILAPTTAIATDLSANPTYFTIPVYPYNVTATGATFTVNYGVHAATVVSSPSNFNVGDSLALPSGAGTLTVASLSGSEIATVTVGTAGSYTSLFSSPVTATRAAGSGETFTAHYGVYAATLGAAGTGYVVNDVLTLSGTGGATITVNSVTSGAVTTFTLTTPGTVTVLPSNPVAVTGGTGTGATFNLTWKLLSVSTSGSGTGYNVGDTLTFVGLTATLVPTAHISGVTAGDGAPTTITIDGAGQGISVAASSITTSTTTATFDLSYTVVSVSSSGGTGYAVSDNLFFDGMVATSMPLAHISTATGGAATAVTVTAAGSGITTAASTISVAGVTEYALTINQNRLSTTAGNGYMWNTKSSFENSAVILTYS